MVDVGGWGLGRLNNRTVSWTRTVSTMTIGLVSCRTDVMESLTKVFPRGPKTPLTDTVERFESLEIRTTSNRVFEKDKYAINPATAIPSIPIISSTA